MYQLVGIKCANLLRCVGRGYNLYIKLVGCRLGSGYSRTKKKKKSEQGEGFTELKL